MLKDIINQAAQRFGYTICRTDTLAGLMAQATQRNGRAPAAQSKQLEIPAEPDATAPQTDVTLPLSDYDGLSQRFFGKAIHRDIRNVKLHSAYEVGSEYFNRCYQALLEVEHDYIQHLIIELRERHVQGVFAEFGIFQGAWINRLFDMTQRAGLTDRLIYGFDSFQGLSPPDPHYDTEFWKEGMYAASLAEVRENVAADERPRIKLVEGFFSESLKSPAAQALEKVAFARIDCDIFEPALQCLRYLSNRLSHGSILVFDDWTFNYEVGEGRAFAQWAESVPHLRFRFLFLGPWDHLHLRVLHSDKEDNFS